MKEIELKLLSIEKNIYIVRNKNKIKVEKEENVTMHDEKKTDVLTGEVHSIDEIVKKLKEDKILVDDFMFFQLVNIAGLAPGEYQKLGPEEEKRRWDLLFSLPQKEANE